MIRSVSERYRWLVPILFVASVILTIAIGASAGTSAGAAGDGVNPEVGNHIHAADLDGAGRFSGPGEVWPPRPDGAVGPASLVPEATLISGDSLSSEAQLASADPAVAAALGTAWSMTDMQSAVADGKGNEDASTSMVEFFSLSNNQTVTATIVDGAVTAVDVVAPTDYQPVISPAEKTQAVQIARDHFLAEGADINDLNGYAIRAFDGDNGYFDTRMVYISFHVDPSTIDMARAEG